MVFMAGFHGRSLQGMVSRRGWRVKLGIRRNGGQLEAFAHADQALGAVDRWPDAKMGLASGEVGARRPKRHEESGLRAEMVPCCRA